MTDVAKVAAPSQKRSRNPVTYGEAQEEAAQALNQLIVFDDPPIEPGDVDLLLQCREGVISAVHQRLFALGLERVPLVKSTEVTAATLTVADFLTRQSAMLGAVVTGLRRLPAQRRARPTDTLGTPHGHPTVERWRTASVALLAGSHALDSAADQPWRRDAGAGWYLVRDLAFTIEALVVLDTRLREIGILNDLPAARDTFTGEDARLVSSQCGRAATWYATTDVADQATAEPTGRTNVVAGPIRLVTRPTDVAAAQRQLAGYLRGLGPPDVLGAWGEQLSAAVARMVMASQLLIVTYGEILTDRCTHPDAPEIRENFRGRRQVLEAVQTAMANLVDHEPVHDDKRVVWQQGEITTAIRRLERSRHPGSLSAEQLLDLAGATHEVTRVAAECLRNELFRPSGNLRVRDPFGDIGHTRVPNGHPLDLALADLRHLPPPSTPITHYQVALHRAALRTTLDLTPTTTNIPEPFTHPRAPERGGPAW